jgi:hypothetical protein
MYREGIRKEVRRMKRNIKSKSGRGSQSTIKRRMMEGF